MIRALSLYLFVAAMLLSAMAHGMTARQTLPNPPLLVHGGAGR